MNVTASPIIPKHYNEWVDESAVSPEITKLNLRSLSDPELIRFKLNWKAYKHTPGWWCGGIDPSSNKASRFGQFKPDEKISLGNKAAKYVTPKGMTNDAVFLQMPNEHYWTDIKSDPSAPIVITEGVKKAGALLTAGYAAIALTGVWNGQIDRNQLVERLQWFCVPGRPIHLCFDSDILTKPGVQEALINLGTLLKRNKCEVSVVNLPQDQKGVDDYVVANGAEKLTELINSAQSYSSWCKKIKEDLPAEKLTFYQEIMKDLYGSGHWVVIKDEFYRFTGTYYEKVDKETEMSRIHRYCNTRYVYQSSRKEYPYADPKYLSSAMKWIVAGLAIAPGQVNPPGINCKNGILKIKWDGRIPSWELKPHSPDEIYIYEPLATFDPNADTTACNKLFQALDKDQLDIFLKTIAASFDLENVRRYKGRIKGLLLQGFGSNGKDTFREVVSKMYGNQGMISCTLQDFSAYDRGRKFPLSELEFARVSWSSENSSFNKLDNIQSLKQAITGDSLDYEKKGANQHSGPCNAVFMFNCNEPPSVTGAMEAIKSRFSVIKFCKTFALNANPSRGEIEADPRFKYDPSFIEDSVLPAFLNYVLDALYRLMTDGIKYDATEKAMKEIQEQSNHLYQFCRERGLVYSPHLEIGVNDLWKELEDWYVSNGTLQIEYDENGSEKKRIWHDQVNAKDKNVKAVNQVYARFAELFPKVKKQRSNKENATRTKPFVITGFGFTDDLEKEYQSSLNKNEITEELDSVRPVATQRASSVQALCDQLCDHQTHAQQGCATNEDVQGTQKNQTDLQGNLLSSKKDNLNQDTEISDDHESETANSQSETRKPDQDHYSENNSRDENENWSHNLDAQGFDGRTTGRTVGSNWSHSGRTEPEKDERGSEMSVSDSHCETEFRMPRKGDRIQYSDVRQGWIDLDVINVNGCWIDCGSRAYFEASKNNHGVVWRLTS